METIERVARAICKASRYNDNNHDWTCFTPQAQAAIDAMQEDIAEADNKVREECAAICENMTEAYSIADDCADVIRSTITPASRQDDAQSAE
jgi:hypothetical protein